jgi:hypothetical protein
MLIIETTKMASKKTLKDKKEKPSKQKVKTDQEASAVQENPFDFGGLPKRDFKKALGCGG